MKHHIFSNNWIERFFYSKKAFSIIEVLIVMAITGFTLIALLNLAVRDLLIEQVNEQSDVSNFISVAQMEGFDNIKSNNPGCLTKLQSNYALNIKYYYICHASAFNGLSQVAECDQAAGAKWYLFYENPNTGSSYQNLAYSNGTYDCTAAIIPAKQLSYAGHLQVLSAAGNILQMSSEVQRSNSAFQSQPQYTYVQEKYYF